MSAIRYNDNDLRLKKIGFSLGFIFFIRFVAAQSTLNIQTGLDFMGLGSLGGYKFEKDGSVLSRGGAGYYVVGLGFGTKLQWRWRQQLSFDLLYQLTEYDLGVHDDGYMKR